MKYFVILSILFGIFFVPVFGEDSCDINNETEVRNKLDQDPVVRQFLELHPSALFQHYKTHDEPGTQHAFSEFQHDGLRLRVTVSEHDDQGNCYRIDGYSVEYDFPESGAGSSTKITQYDTEQWRDAVSAVKDLTNPRKQMKMGVPIYAIKCKEGLYPIPKVDRITPACVTDEVNSKLLLRGWTPLRIGMPAETNVLISYDAKMVFPYKVTKEFDPRFPYFSIVYWVNNDIVSHKIIAIDGSWKTDEIKPGKIGSMSFNKTGIYDYFVEGKSDTRGVVMFERTIEFESDEKIFFPKQSAIKKIQDTIDSESSYDDWRQEIQTQVDENNLGQFSSVFLKDMKQEFQMGEKISFNLVNFGYRDWCLMPSIYVYHEDYIMPVYENAIVHPCPPPSDKPSSRISIFSEQDFRTFPTCQLEGTYTIWAKTYEFDSQVIGSFYCNSEKKFTPPKTYEIVIPFGSSEFDLQNNFTPSEISMKYGDYLKITNLDNKIHDVILFADRQSGSAVLTTSISPDDSFSMPVYNLGTFKLTSWDEN